MSYCSPLVVIVLSNARSSKLIQIIQYYFFNNNISNHPSTDTDYVDFIRLSAGCNGYVFRKIGGKEEGQL